MKSIDATTLRLIVHSRCLCMPVVRHSSCLTADEFANLVFDTCCLHMPKKYPFLSHFLLLPTKSNPAVGWNA